jgi:hypothetical protein
MPPGIQNRSRRLIHEDAVRHGQAFGHVIGDRLEVEAGASGPITQRGAIQRNPLSSVDIGLSIKRQMIAKLRDDHLGDQRLGRQPARHDMLGSMRLRHGTGAATARIFRATGHQHSELRRDHIETLGDVFADHRHRTASARTHRAARFNQPLHARQVSGQLAAVASARMIRASRLSADDRLGFFLRGIQHALGDFDVFNRQIVLVRRQLFRLRAELLTTQITDDALEPTPGFLGGGKSRLMLGQRRLRPRQERFQGSVFFHQRA